MESRITTATWLLVVHLVLYGPSRKEKQPPSAARSLPGTSQGYGLVARASGRDSLITSAPQLGPGLSWVCPSCPRSRSGSPPDSHPEAWLWGRQAWFQWLLTGFPPFRDRLSGFLPAPGSKSATAPRSSFLPSFPPWRPDAVLGETWSELGKTILKTAPCPSGAPGTSKVGL